MPDRLRLFILAGEASGDRIAADLVARLMTRTPVDLIGVGGPELEALGLKSLFPMRELSVMGWADVLPRLPRLLWRARQVAQSIVSTQPDVVVLVDSQVFSTVVARAVRRRDSRVPMLLYVAPAVWAWKPERAASLNGLFDEVLAVLPFEPSIMKALGGPPTAYVGHPAATRFTTRVHSAETGPLLLLPGSREGELRRHLPIMRHVAERLATHARVSSLVLPTPSGQSERVAAEVAGWPVPVQVISDDVAKSAAFDAAVAAVAVTGTVTLELALAGVPMVTTYVADRRQEKHWRHYKAKFASLPNVLLGRPLVPEILGVSVNPAAVAEATTALLGDHAAQTAGFAEIRSLMERGLPDEPPADPAARVLARVGDQRSPTAT